MSLLLETIRLHDGQFHNLLYHELRMAKALRLLFGRDQPVNLEEYLRLKIYPKQGLFKCRVVYDAASMETEFVPYQVRKVGSVKIVQGDDISYRFKYANRQAIDRLFQQRGACDDVLIVRRGQITDCSYSNVVFRRGSEWITPSAPLLEGTMRQQLLDLNKITAREVEILDLRSFASFKIVNAMLGFDGPEIDVSNIVF